MEEINPDKDTDIVIEKYKSGDVPPADFNSTFGEMSDPRSLLGNLFIHYFLLFFIWPPF